MWFSHFYNLIKERALQENTIPCKDSQERRLLSGLLATALANSWLGVADRSLRVESAPASAAKVSLQRPGKQRFLGWNKLLLSAFTHLAERHTGSAYTVHCLPLFTLAISAR